MLKINNLSQNDLKSKLNWINESRQSFNQGFASYVFKQFKKAGGVEKIDDGLSVFLLTAALFGNTDNDNSIESKFSSELYSFILNFKVPSGDFEGQLFLDVIDHKRLTVKIYKEIMLNYLDEYEKSLIENI
jgi:hypothetical protein